MTDCPSCGAESEKPYRCSECGADLVANEEGGAIR